MIGAASADKKPALRDPRPPSAARSAVARGVSAWFRELCDLLVAAGDVTGALDVLERAVAVHGRSPAFLMLALEIETADRRFDAALGRIADLQRQAPRPEPWMARRAELHASAGRNPEALAAWEALRRHVESLPNLERGIPAVTAPYAEALTALGVKPLAPVVAPPADHPAPETKTRTNPLPDP